MRFKSIKSAVKKLGKRKLLKILVTGFNQAAYKKAKRKKR